MKEGAISWIYVRYHATATHQYKAMPLPGAPTRRKPTTYGKRSRPHVPNLSPAAGDEFGRASRESNRDDTKTQIRIAGSPLQSNRTITSASNNAAKIMAEVYTPNILKPSSSKQRTALVRPKLYVPLEASLISPNSDTDTLYDVPSSDEERAGRSSSRGPTVGKRRKVTPEMEPEVVTYVYDDETLQRHIAAEAYINTKPNSPSTRQTAGKARPQLSQGLTKKLQGNSVESASVKRQALTTARYTTKPIKTLIADDSSKAVVSYLQSQKRKRTNGRETAKNGSAKTQTMSNRHPKSSGDAHMSFNGRNVPAGRAMEPMRRGSRYSNEDSSHSENLMSQPQTPPQTPPRSLKPTSGTTTRQRELWDRLLKDNEAISSPSNLHLPNLKIADSKVDLPLGYRADRDTPNTVTQPMPPTRSPRRRLVDKLQRIDKDRLDSSDDSEEEISSDDDTGYSNLQSQASNEHSILPLDASQNVNAQYTGSNTRNSAFSKVAQPIGQGAGLKVTYARQRSYLTDDGLGEAAIFGISITHEAAPDTKHGRRRARTTVAEYEPVKIPYDEMDDKECSQGGTIRSIHELREAGGTVRLVSEMETMLDDIDEKNTVSVPLRRTALLDLVVKLQEASFCRLFIGQRLELRLLANVRLSNDVIINALYAVAVLYLLADPTSIQTLPRVSAEHVVNHLVGLLDNDQDLAKLLRDRRLNMSKLTQLDFKNCFGSVLKSANWRGDNPPILTPRVLCLQCLEYLVRQTRETGSEAEVLPLQAMRRIVKILEPAAPSLTALPTIPLTTDLRLAVSILESCTLSTTHLASGLLWTGETLDTVLNLLPLLVPIKDRASGTLQTLVLRLYLNLTNNSSELCKAFARPDPIRAVFDIIISHFQYLSNDRGNTEQSLMLDNLILSLGFLVNLAEWCDSLGHMVMELCYGDVTFLESLLVLFVAKLEKTSEVRSFLS